MRRLTQPWKLCRSFGSRPVGSVVVPRWPEAGITAQVIPTQPSSRTFREGQSPTADLHTGFLPLLRRFPPFKLQGQGLPLKLRLNIKVAPSQARPLSIESVGVDGLRHFSLGKPNSPRK